MDTSHAQAAGYAGRHTARRARPLAGLRARRPVVALTAALLAGGALVALPASAAVPSFPDNIVVFPDRDFLGLEGFEGSVGQTATIDVFRGTQKIGSAAGPLAGGDPALEVNHPGGVCWGTATPALPVTPDLKAGDKVVVSIPSSATTPALSYDTTVADAAVSSVERDGAVVTVRGEVGPGVNTAFTEQRIINPDLKELAVGRRDIRATLAGSEGTGYESTLAYAPAVDGRRAFTAVYTFADPGVAAVAAEGQARIMSWLEEDGDGNRQGLTISEFQEVGGPGMGGCPAGPDDQAAPTPGTATFVRGTTTETSTTAEVRWSPTAPVPGAPAIAGFAVTAIETTAGPTRATVGQRVSDPAATSATLRDLKPGVAYTVEVAALDQQGATGKPMVARQTTPTAPPPSGGTDTSPTVTADPPSGTLGPVDVTLSGLRISELYYTTDGSDPLQGGDTLSPTAQLYSGPIAAVATPLKWVAFSAEGFYTTGEASYTAAVVPSAPQAVTVTQINTGQNVRVTWQPPATNAAAVTGYNVSLDGDAPRPVTAGTTELRIDGVGFNADHVVTVTAVGAQGSSAPAASPTFRLIRATAEAPTAPTNVAATAGHESASVTFGRSTAVGNTINRYEVLALGPGAPTTPVVVLPATGVTAFSATVPGLRNGETYTVQVTAVSSGELRTAATSGPVVPSNVIAIVTSEFRTGRNEWRVEGTSRAPGTVVTVTYGPTNARLGAATVQADGTWAYRERNTAPARRPAVGDTVTATSTPTGAVSVTAAVTRRS